MIVVVVVVRPIFMLVFTTSVRMTMAAQYEEANEVGGQPETSHDKDEKRVGDLWRV